MQNKYLKPCPFCGGSDIRFSSHVKHHWVTPRTPTHAQGATIYAISCYRCGVNFPNCYSKEALVEGWNRRNLPIQE